MFGPRAKDNEDVRGMLNAGHRKGAKAGRCVVKGATVMTEELDAYCAVALAGLDDLPDTLMTRSVVVRMRRRAPHEIVEPFRYRVNAPQGAEIRRRLMEWTQTIPLAGGPRCRPDRRPGRRLLGTVARRCGCRRWSSGPKRARCAGVTLVTDAKAAPPSIGVRLLADLRTVFDEAESEHLFTEDILKALWSRWSWRRGRTSEGRRSTPGTWPGD